MSEQPSTIYSIPNRSGTADGSLRMDSDTDVALFKDDVLSVSKFSRETIDRTLASAARRSPELSPEILMVRRMKRQTEEILAARIEDMEIGDRPFLKDAA